MQKNKTIISLAVMVAGFLVLFLFVPCFVHAEAGDNCGDLSVNETDCQKNDACFWWVNKCASRTDMNICSELPMNLCGPNNEIGSNICVKSADNKTCQAPMSKSSNKGSGSAPAQPQLYAIPASCLSPDWATRQAGCRDINVLLQLIVNFGAGLFFLVGAFAFAFFIYGGFTMILSFGNAEKVKKGRDILVAAIIGLIIVFVAYAAVRFLLVDVLQVKGPFVGIK